MVEQLTFGLKLLTHAETSWSQVRVLPTAQDSSNINPMLSDNMEGTKDYYAKLDYRLRKLDEARSSYNETIQRYPDELKARVFHLYGENSLISQRVQL